MFPQSPDLSGLVPGLPSVAGVLVTMGKCGSDTLMSGDNKVGITWPRLDMEPVQDLAAQYTR